VPIRFVGHHTLSDGGAILGIALPFGQANAVTLIRLSQIAEQQGATTLCPAPDHALLITGLPLGNVEAMADAAAGLGLITDPGDARLGIAACSGAPACASGHFDTRVVARALGLRYPELMTHGRRVHISGCSKGCAHPSAADLAIVGRPDGIALVIDGRADGIPATVLPHPQPSALVAEIMKILETTK